jgi:diphosphomevalonate decarboxylase
MKKVHATATPNIALIKYWGNRNNELRLPAADSLSMTLDRPSLTLSLEESDQFSLTSFLNGEKKDLKPEDQRRFEHMINLSRRYLQNLGYKKPFPRSFSLEIQSAIPPRIGLASSAAVFAAFAKALSTFAEPERALTDAEISVLARFGSGSAARSIFGGFAMMHAGSSDDMASAFASQIANEQHWPLHDIIIAPSHDEKKVGSTEGHALAQTSAHFKERIKQIPRRMKECTDAILKKDFEKLQHMSEEDALDMHHVMETSTPSLQYLTDETHRIIKEIEDLRSTDHLEVLYTVDAGPTVHLICTDAARPTILDYAKSKQEKGCTVFKTQIGQGAITIHQ